MVSHYEKYLYASEHGIINVPIVSKDLTTSKLTYNVTATTSVVVILFWLNIHLTKLVNL